MFPKSDNEILERRQTCQININQSENVEDFYQLNMIVHRNLLFFGNELKLDFSIKTEVKNLMNFSNHPFHI